jgi:hypothetical protein
MQGVVELSAEGSKRWELFHLSRITVSMTDAADPMVLLLEMLGMATRTRDMARKFDFARSVFSRVADQAR